MNSQTLARAEGCEVSATPETRESQETQDRDSISNPAFLLIGFIILSRGLFHMEMKHDIVVRAIIYCGGIQVALRLTHTHTHLSPHDWGMVTLLYMDNRLE